MGFLKRFHRDCKGQALVEMALVLPILLMLLFGIIEFGRVFNAYLVTSQASREGARAAAVGSADADVVQSARKAAGIFDPAEVAVNIKPKAPRETGQAVTVKVSYDLDLVAPFINVILPDPMTITGSTVMRVE